MPTVGEMGEEAAYTPQASPILEHAARERARDLKSIAPNDNSRIILYSSLVAVVITALAGLVVQYFSVQENAKLGRAESKLQEVTASLQTGQNAVYLAEVNKVADQLDVFQTMRGDLVLWPELLAATEELVPNQIQFVAAVYDDTQKTLTIDGEASSHQDVAKLIKSLDQATVFSTVKLESSSLNESPTETVVAFTVSAVYEPITQTTTETATELEVTEGAIEGDNGQ
jgi:hypothetical protein